MSKNTNLSFLTDYITADITNGRIGINNASPTVAFDVVGATKITGNVGISGSPSNGLIPGLVIGDGTDNKGITLFGTTTTQQNIAFTDTANSQQGLIQYDHSGDYMRFFTATSERMRITSAGNVGIGTASPQSALSFSTTSHIGVATVDGSDNGYMSIGGGGEGGDARGAGMYFSGNERTTFGGQLAIFAGNVGTSGFINFNTGGSERMRITSGGELYWNITATTAAGLSSGGIAFRNNSSKYIQLSTGVTTDQGFIYFYKSDGAGGVTNTGSISSSGSATVYNTTSDYRLKEDLKLINGLEILNKIKVYDYKWKASDDRMDGVLAHELQEVIPYAVTGIKDGEDMQGVDYSKIVPVMLKAIQELSAEITILKNK